MRRILLGIGAALLLGVSILVAFLVEAHIEVRGVAPPLPDRAAIESALADAVDPPVRLTYVNTATQDPILHPAFLFEWADGRGLLVDAGMDRQSAIEFGRLIQRLRPDAPPAEPHGSLPEQMGDAARRIRAIAFTHLHRDHTAGILPLCEEREDPLRVFWTDYQAERVNVWTRQGREHVRQASCARPERLDGSPLHPLPGFPGIVAFAAGGHTPGSTVFFARVGDTTWILSGDITNFRANLIDDVPKEWVYSYLLVPEARGRLATLRPWLRGLDARDGWSVVVSHDRAALLESGLEPWRPARP